MKKLTSSTEWFGPFNEIDTTQDSYVCDGAVFPFVVVGECVISDYDPEKDIHPAPPMTDEQKQALYDSIVSQTQFRLDDFAKTRGYDGILSAASYATSPTEKFATEGQYCLTQRDATWAELINIFNEVQAGTRPIPSSYADVEPEIGRAHV